jgi:hypothetical protein
MKSALLVVVLLAGCSASHSPGAAACEPFAQLAHTAGSAEHKELLRRASEDFCAVLAGQPPVHAKPKAGGGPSDGGSLEYEGKGYSLTALQSLSIFGSVYGVVEGPVLTFDAPFAAGHTRVISQTRFVAVPAE